MDLLNCWIQLIPTNATGSVSREININKTEDGMLCCFLNEGMMRKRREEPDASKKGKFPR
jgi:hypothetical protein